MRRDPTRSIASLPAASRGVPLVVKDGLRELRFIARQSARRWLEEVEETLTHIPAVGAPLGTATKTASRLLQMADSAAVDLLSADAAYRQMDFRFSPPDEYLRPPEETAARMFLKNHFWGLKHLLKLKGETSFRVLEQAVFQAYQRFRQCLSESEPVSPALPGGSLPAPSESSILSAKIVHALYRSKPLIHHDWSGGDPVELAEAIATLTLHACVTVVLASETAPFVHRAAAADETREALTLADEIVAARLPAWEAAMLAERPVWRLAREMDFTLRHL